MMTRRRSMPFLLPLLPALFFSGAQTSRTTAEPARPRKAHPLEVPVTPAEIQARWRKKKP